MIGSMFSLDHRLGELRPSERDLELARRLREAAASPKASARSTGSDGTRWRGASRVTGQPSRLAAG